MSDLKQFQQRLGYQFANPELLKQALAHPSAFWEQGRHLETNQRLEFLGDAVLQYTLTRTLYEKFPNLTEGELTKLRAGLVNRRMLTERARSIGLGPMLQMSASEVASGGRDKVAALADGFEALIGAICLDNGLESAFEFILREFADYIRTAKVESDNPKGDLQEILQAISVNPPTYEIVTSSGPDHNRSFEARVLHDGHELARGSGPSKKAAESAAALAALHLMKDNKDENQEESTQ